MLTSKPLAASRGLCPSREAAFPLLEIRIDHWSLIIRRLGGGFIGLAALRFVPAGLAALVGVRFVLDCPGAPRSVTLAPSFRRLKLSAATTAPGSNPSTSETMP